MTSGNLKIDSAPPGGAEGPRRGASGGSRIRPKGDWNLTGEAKLHGRFKVSQTEIAKRTGLAVTTVSKILKSGTGQWKNIQKVARAMGLTLDEFAFRYCDRQKAS